MAKTRFYKDLKQLAKQANQRMVRLEQAGIKSPAYEAAQAKLEMIGRRPVSDTKGRRFSETGKATYNEYEQIKKILEEFIEQKTSTVKGANKYIEDVWQGAQKSKKISVDLKKAGITKEEWFEIWKNLPSKKTERMYGSSEYIRLVAVYKTKGDKSENEMEVADLIKEFENGKDMKSALESLGLSYNDYEIAKGIGVL